MPHEEFKKILKNFFNEAEWKTEGERKTA